jgi:hypothetical protein
MPRTFYSDMPATGILNLLYVEMYYCNTLFCTNNTEELQIHLITCVSLSRIAYHAEKNA